MSPLSPPYLLQIRQRSGNGLYLRAIRKSKDARLADVHLKQFLVRYFFLRHCLKFINYITLL